MNPAPPIDTLTGCSMHIPTYAQIQQHQRTLWRSASHQLPTHPPTRHVDCMAFRQLAQRLVAWDRRHAYRSGTEHWLAQYPRQSSDGPEVLWAVYPQHVLVRQAPPPVGPAPGGPERAVVPEPARRVSSTTEEESAASTRSTFSPPPSQVIVGPDGHHDGGVGSVSGGQKDEGFESNNKRPIPTIVDVRTADGGEEDEEEHEMNGNKRAKFTTMS